MIISEEQITINKLIVKHLHFIFSQKNKSIMTTATLDKMRSMRLFGMHQAYESAIQNTTIKQFSKDELMAHMVDAEWTDRSNRRLERLLKSAQFRYPAKITDIDYAANRQLDKELVLRLTSCDFVRRSENIIILGSTGVGKSFIASALGHQACLLGMKTLYANVYKLFSKLKMAQADGSYHRILKRIEKQDLLILDDFGLKPMDNHARMALMEMIEDRHQKSSTIITTQLPIKHWHESIGESTIADAILDRLVHSAHRIEMKGESLRKIQASKKEK